MTKREIFKTVKGILAEHDVAEEPSKAILGLLEPKRGGMKLDINDIACFDEEGQPTYILCSYLKKWVPVFDADGKPNFYKKADTELGWSRFSRMGEKLRKEADKRFKATKDAVLNDLLSGAITNEDAKALLDEAEAAKANLEVPAEFEALDERPCE